MFRFGNSCRSHTHILNWGKSVWFFLSVVSFDNFFSLFGLNAITLNANASKWMCAAEVCMHIVTGYQYHSHIFVFFSFEISCRFILILVCFGLNGSWSGPVCVQYILMDANVKNRDVVLNINSFNAWGHGKKYGICDDKMNRAAKIFTSFDRT